MILRQKPKPACDRSLTVIQTKREGCVDDGIHAIFREMDAFTREETLPNVL